MTGPEFDQWFKHFTAAFPQAKEFVRKSDATGEATLTLWFGVMQKRELADCLEVTNRMFAGEMPMVPGTDRGFPDFSQVPKHVSRLCAELHPVEPQWKQHTRERAYPKQGIIDRDASMSQAYKQAMKILDDGGTMDDVRALLDEIYGTVSRVRKDVANYDHSFDEFNQAEAY